MAHPPFYVDGVIKERIRDHTCLPVPKKRTKTLSSWARIRSINLVSALFLAYPTVYAQSQAKLEQEDVTEAQPAEQSNRSNKPASMHNSSVAEAPYVDRLINENVAPEELVAPSEEAEAAGTGRHQTVVEYKLYSRNQTALGASLEQGVGLRWRQETLNYGVLDLDAVLRNFSPAPNDPLQQSNTTRDRITLNQFGFPVKGRWQMDNSLGFIRGSANPLVSNSFRLYLPSSLLEGVSSRVYDTDSELRVTYGGVGKLNGIATQQFDRESGELAGIGYSRKLRDGWTAAAQLYDLHGNDTIPDHQSLAWVAQYEQPDLSRRYQLHGLTDSKKNYGLWLDGEERVQSWQHRFGAYYLQPNLLWTDATVSADQEGFYIRSDQFMLRHNLSAGVEYNETNVDNDPTRSGTRNVLGFVSGYRRLNKDTSTGGNLTVTDSEPKFLLPGVESSQTYSANVNLTRAFPFGLSRFQVSHSQIVASLTPGHQNGITWDHDWIQSNRLQFTTTLQFSRENRAGIDSERTVTGALFRNALSSDFSWDGSVLLTNVNGDPNQRQFNTNASLGAAWGFFTNWLARLQLIWNRIDNTLPGISVSTHDNSLLFTLRYELSGGSPLVQVGKQTGSVGSGRIVGRVFFDENGDGVRQPTERGAPGVTVYLDGRFAQSTDSEGRFEFAPTPTGDHTVSVVLENVPLPWGLLEESPRKISVPLRGEGLIEIPLIRLNR